jgi:hypothetical protein
MLNDEYRLLSVGCLHQRPAARHHRASHRALHLQEYPQLYRVIFTALLVKDAPDIRPDKPAIYDIFLILKVKKGNIHGIYGSRHLTTHLKIGLLSRISGIHRY